MFASCRQGKTGVRDIFFPPKLTLISPPAPILKIHSVITKQSQLFFKPYRVALDISKSEERILTIVCI